jgi:hypothetical protein
VLESREKGNWTFGVSYKGGISLGTRAIIIIRRRTDLRGDSKLVGWSLSLLHSSSNIIMTIKLKDSDGQGYVADIGEMKMHTTCMLRSLKGRDHLQDVNIDAKIILK